MFESVFEKIGRGVSKNSGKIIVIWIVLIVLMGYGALLVFSHTSFNITNGFGTGKSMSANATSEVSKYFDPSAAGKSSNSSELIIVVQNITTTTSSGMNALISFQNRMDSYLKTAKNYTGTESIVVIERSTLQNYTAGIEKLMSANYQAAASINKIEYGINGSTSIFLIPEEIYYESFTGNYSAHRNVTQAESYAYDSVLKVLSSSPEFELQKQYTNIFSSYVNATSKSSNGLTNSIQTGSKLSLKNGSFNQSLIRLYPIGQFVISNQSLQSYMTSSLNENVNLSLQFLKYETAQSANSTNSLFSLIVSTDNVSLVHLAYLEYNLSLPATSLQLNSISVMLTESSTLKDFSGNPLFQANKNYLPRYIWMVLNSTSVNSVVNKFMANYPLQDMPIVPTSYLYHNFVGFDKSTSIFIYSFNGNYSNQVSVKVQSIANNATSGFKGSKFLIAGSNELASQLSGEISSGLIKALGVGILLSILVVGLFFRSVKAAFLPILMFIISAIVSLGIIGYLYTYVLHSEASFITPTLLLIFVLGLSSDYTVYLMARYRSELRKKTDRPTVVTARWAGHAVFTSGLTVILSEVVLWLADIPFFSDAGFANAIGVTVALIAANTLLLSILHRYGRKIFKKTESGEFHEGSHKHLHSVGTFSTGHAKAMIAVFVVISIVGLAVYTVTPSGIDILKLLPQSQATTAIQIVNDSFNGDFFDRSFEIVQLPHPLVSNGVVNKGEMSTVLQIENATINTKGISEVLGPGRPYGYYTGYTPSNVTPAAAALYVNQTSTFISSSNPNYVEIVFQTYNIGWGNKAITTVNTLYGNIKSIPHTQSTYAVSVGGLTESLSNALHTTQLSFSQLLPILAVTIFIILLIQLSSVLTPLRLVIMVMAAVLASLSVTYVIFHYIQGFPVVIFMPVFVFITLLAVGLDYDIFMITRVREEVIKGSGLRDAVVTSVTENGSVIMLLGTLLFVTFAALYFSAIPLIQEIGIGVGLGVLIDTFISWPLFIPAIMRIIRKYNWWPSKLSDEP
ncbi:MAG: MMPL family transporter [Candidatus Thermoplasmatota archaeon]|nr:MMPL family transporter [Candidatus Thermoplasmatota archaeon]